MKLTIASLAILAGIASAAIDCRHAQMTRWLKDGDCSSPAVDGQGQPDSLVVFKSVDLADTNCVVDSKGSTRLSYNRSTGSISAELHRYSKQCGSSRPTMAEVNNEGICEKITVYHVLHTGLRIDCDAQQCGAGACGAHNICESDGFCTCKEGFTGKDCEIPPIGYTPDASIPPSTTPSTTPSSSPSTTPSVSPSHSPIPTRSSSVSPSPVVSPSASTSVARNSATSPHANIHCRHAKMMKWSKDGTCSSDSKSSGSVDLASSNCVADSSSSGSTKITYDRHTGTVSAELHKYSSHCGSSHAAKGEVKVEGKCTDVVVYGVLHTGFKIECDAQQCATGACGDHGVCESDCFCTCQDGFSGLDCEIAPAGYISTTTVLPSATPSTSPSSTPPLVPSATPSTSPSQTPTPTRSSSPSPSPEISPSASASVAHHSATTPHANIRCRHAMMSKWSKDGTCSSGSKSSGPVDLASSNCVADSSSSGSTRISYDKHTGTVSAELHKYSSHCGSSHAAKGEVRVEGECTDVVVYGVLHTGFKIKCNAQQCPTGACGDHGSCGSDGFCTCRDGFTGIDCEIAPAGYISTSAVLTSPTPSTSPSSTPSLSPSATPSTSPSVAPSTTASAAPSQTPAPTSSTSTSHSPSPAPSASNTVVYSVSTTPSVIPTSSPVASNLPSVSITPTASVSQGPTVVTVSVVTPIPMIETTLPNPVNLATTVLPTPAPTFETTCAERFPGQTSSNVRCCRWGGNKCNGLNKCMLDECNASSIEKSSVSTSPATETVTYEVTCGDIFHGNHIDASRPCCRWGNKACTHLTKCMENTCRKNGTSSESGQADKAHKSEGDGNTITCAEKRVLDEGSLGQCKIDAAKLCCRHSGECGALSKCQTKTCCLM